jgi:hypothetical protein
VLLIIGIEITRHPWSEYLPTACMHVLAWYIGIKGGLLLSTVLHGLWNWHALQVGGLLGSVLAVMYAAAVGGRVAVGKSVLDFGAVVVRDMDSATYECRPCVVRDVCVDVFWSQFACGGEIRARSRLSLVGNPVCREGSPVTPLGIQIFGVVASVFRSCFHCEEKALRQRALMPPFWEGREELVVAEIRAVWRRWLAWLLEVVRIGPAWARPLAKTAGPGGEGADRRIVSTPFWDWVMRFPPGTRDMLIEAWKRRRLPLGASDLRYEMFIKRERLVQYTQETFRSDKKRAPRVIQGRSFPVRVRTGPYLHAETKRLSEVWSAGSNSRQLPPVTYGSGKTTDEIGCWVTWANERLFELGSPIWLKGDISRLDGNTHDEWQRQKNRFSRMVGEPAHCRAVTSQRGHKSGMSAKGKFRYSVEGTVASGDGDTSSGDTLFVGLTALDAMTSPDEVRDDANGSFVLLTGDDHIIGTTRERLEELGGIQRIKDKFARVGYENNVFTELHIERLDFCSGMFYPTTDGGYMFGPLGARVLCKTFASHIRFPAHERRGRLRGVALGLRRVARVVPLLRAYIPAVLHATRNVRAIFDREDERRYRTVAEADLDEDRLRVHYEDRYNIAWSDVTRLEGVLATLGDAVVKVKDPVLAHMAMVDMGRTG